MMSNCLLFSVFSEYETYIFFSLLSIKCVFGFMLASKINALGGFFKIRSNFLPCTLSNVLDHQFCLGFSRILLVSPVPLTSSAALLIWKQKYEALQWSPGSLINPEFLFHNDVRVQYPVSCKYIH